MSAALLFLIPVGLLAVIWSVCFVGCIPPDNFSGAIPYSNIVLSEPSLIAYWPLSDFANAQLPAGAPALPPPPEGSTGLGVALDIAGGNHNGTYIVPPAYPAGASVPGIVANPTLDLHQASFVPGDAFMTGSKNLPACVDFEGGYVSIPWAANSPALTDFTLEAWVEPKWTVTGFNWVVFAARNNNNTGFEIQINELNRWQLAIGTGTALTVIDTLVPAAVAGGITYVAVTFQSSTQLLSLWLDPGTDTSATPTANWPPSPATTTPYAANDPTQAMTFFIGAAGNSVAPRTQAGGTGSPTFPFQGLIQSVALYDTALDPGDLALHFAEGTG